MISIFKKEVPTDPSPRSDADLVVAQKRPDYAAVLVLNAGLSSPIKSPGVPREFAEGDTRSKIEIFERQYIALPSSNKNKLPWYLIQERLESDPLQPILQESSRLIGLRYRQDKNEISAVFLVNDLEVSLVFMVSNVGDFLDDDIAPPTPHSGILAVAKVGVGTEFLLGEKSATDFPPSLPAIASPKPFAEVSSYFAQASSTSGSKGSSFDPKNRLTTLRIQYFKTQYFLIPNYWRVFSNWSIVEEIIRAADPQIIAAIIEGGYNMERVCLKGDFLHVAFKNLSGNTMEIRGEL